MDDINAIFIYVQISPLCAWFS